MTLLCLFMTGITLYAQPGGAPPHKKMQEQTAPCEGMPPGMPPAMHGAPEAQVPPIPDLSKEQIDKIKLLNQQLRKQILSFDAQIMEKEAKLQTQKIADKPDIRAMNGLIDDISTLHGSIMKLLNETHFKIRDLLTEDQKLVFDELPPPTPPHR